MTDFNFCCLCASDEGVFLDIITATDRQLGNRSFLKEFETCLSLKINQDEELSSKICYKCAIELGQCNQFVERYHQAHDVNLKLRGAVLRKSCYLCLSTDENSHLFILAKDFCSAIDPLQKIYECFNKQISREEAESRSICILCRYNLDLLYDLKKLASERTSKLQRISESKAILASLPKTQTFVISRKTTVICQSRIEFQTKSDSDSDCDTMGRRSSKTKNPKTVKSPIELKLRTCGQCHTSIEGGIDMYRLHSTGLTICKMCWITMDPFNSSRSSKRKRSDQAETKNTRLCAVFVKDVLSPATSKDNGPLMTEKKPKANPIYVVSDEGSNNAQKPVVRSKRNTRSQRDGGAGVTDGESDTNSRPRLKRSLKHGEVKRNSKLNRKLKSVNIEETTVSSSLRRSARYQSSDSDSVKVSHRRSKDSNVKSNVANKSKSPVKLNNVNSGNKPSKNKSNKNDGKWKGANAESGNSKSEDSTSSGDSGVGRKLRKVRNKVPLILKPELPDNSKSEKAAKHAESRTIIPSKSPVASKNLSFKSSAKNQHSRVKPSVKKSKTLMMVSFPFKLKNPYECKVCRTEYKNKIIGMKHELTHFKQVEIKVEKLNINRHFQNVSQNSTKTELPDDSCSLDLPSTNKKAHQTEVSALASLHKNDVDQSQESDHKTDEGETVKQSKTSESIQQDTKSSDIDDIRETDVVTSSNGSLEKEFTLKVNDSETETTENVAETSDEVRKVDTSSAKADSVSKTKITDENATIEVPNETLEKDDRKEESEELGTVVNDIKEEMGAESNGDKEVVLPATKTGPGKDDERERGSGEEMESDTDIRIVDTGSSFEDSSERTEKNTESTQIVSYVSAKVGTDEKLIDTKEESKQNEESKNSPDDVPQIEKDGMDSIIVSKNNLDERNNSEDVSSQNEEKSSIDCELSELCEKIGEDAQPKTVVTDISQEVIDLAVAEVQNRVESEVIPVPETLENISEEIKKTAEASATTNIILESGDAATNKQTDSSVPDLNSITNSVKKYHDIGSPDV